MNDRKDAETKGTHEEELVGGEAVVPRVEDLCVCIPSSVLDFLPKIKENSTHSVVAEQRLEPEPKLRVALDPATPHHTTSSSAHLSLTYTKIEEKRT